MILPSVYACLPDKCADSYVEMIRVIGTIVKPLGDLLNLPFNPLTALTDFEQASFESTSGTEQTFEFESTSLSRYADQNMSASSASLMRLLGDAENPFPFSVMNLESNLKLC